MSQLLLLVMLRLICTVRRSSLPVLQVSTLLYIAVDYRLLLYEVCTLATVVQALELV